MKIKPIVCPASWGVSNNRENETFGLSAFFWLFKNVGLSFKFRRIKNAKITGKTPTKNKTCQPKCGKINADKIAAMMPPSWPPILAIAVTRPYRLAEKYSPIIAIPAPYSPPSPKPTRNRKMQTIVKLFAKYINAVAPAKIKIVYEKIFTRPYLSLRIPKINPPSNIPRLVIVLIIPAWVVVIPKLAITEVKAKDMKLKSMFSKEKPVAVDAITRFWSLLRLVGFELSINIFLQN